MKSVRWVIIAIITCSLLLCILLYIGMSTGELISTQILNATPVIIAILALSFAIILLLKQKRISVDALSLLIMGLFYLSGSIVKFGYGPSSQNISATDQLAYSVRSALLQMGTGMAFVFLGVSQIGHQIRQNRNTGQKILSFYGIFSFGVGIFTLALGLNLLINAFSPIP